MNSTPEVPEGIGSVDCHVRRCGNCIHYGEIRIAAGKRDGMVCLAPVTTEPPANGETPAKYRFVYVAGDPDGLCELWTPFPPNIALDQTGIIKAADRN